MNSSSPHTKKTLGVYHLPFPFAAMSFGGPGGLQKTSKPIPPERGSFPLESVCAPFLFPSPSYIVRQLPLIIKYYSHDGTPLEPLPSRAHACTDIRPLPLLGECKPIIAGYLQCLRRARGTNEEGCRMLAKEYLKCRMQQYVFSPCDCF